MCINYLLGWEVVVYCFLTFRLRLWQSFSEDWLLYSCLNALELHRFLYRSCDIVAAGRHQWQEGSPIGYYHKLSEIEWRNQRQDWTSLQVINTSCQQPYWITPLAARRNPYKLPTNCHSDVPNDVISGKKKPVYNLLPPTDRFQTVKGEFEVRNDI